MINKLVSLDIDPEIVKVVFEARKASFADGMKFVWGLTSLSPEGLINNSAKIDLTRTTGRQLIEAILDAEF